MRVFAGFLCETLRSSGGWGLSYLISGRFPFSGSVMLQHGFVRVAAALPRLRVADCSYNAERLLYLIDQAEQQAVQILVFPELALTGYTCGDLFHQPSLQKAALDALEHLLEESKCSRASRAA